MDKSAYFLVNGNDAIFDVYIRGIEALSDNHRVIIICTNKVSDERKSEIERLKVTHLFLDIYMTQKHKSGALKHAFLDNIKDIHEKYPASSIYVVGAGTISGVNFDDYGCTEIDSIRSYLEHNRDLGVIPETINAGGRMKILID